MRTKWLGSLGLWLLVLSGCTVTAPVKNKTDTPASSRNSDGVERSLGSPVRFVGRVSAGAAGSVQYAWSGAGLVARFSGTGVTVRLKDNQNQHQPILDGQLMPRIVTRAGQELYPVAAALTPGEHRLELYRRTEASFGATTFLGLEVTGGELLAIEPPPSRRLEVVGDSITCGYGIEGDSPSCPFSADTENHQQSYGRLLATRFGAELSTVAWSGRGVVKNYDGGPGDKMGVLYQRILPAVPSSQFRPDRGYDAVVVNLGTNDFSTEPDPEMAVFVAAYVDLLQKIRAYSPSAFVLCTVGPMLNGEDLEKANQGIAEAVRQQRAGGDQRVVAHRMTTSNQNPGCDWHPSVETHRQMAEEMAIPLGSALHW